MAAFLSIACSYCTINDCYHSEMKEEIIHRYLKTKQKANSEKDKNSVKGKHKIEDYSLYFNDRFGSFPFPNIFLPLCIASAAVCCEEKRLPFDQRTACILSSLHRNQRI